MADPAWKGQALPPQPPDGSWHRNGRSFCISSIDELQHVLFTLTDLAPAEQYVLSKVDLTHGVRKEDVGFIALLPYGENAYAVADPVHVWRLLLQLGRVYTMLCDEWSQHRGYTRDLKEQLAKMGFHNALRFFLWNLRPGMLDVVVPLARCHRPEPSVINKAPRFTTAVLDGLADCERAGVYLILSGASAFAGPSPYPSDLLVVYGGHTVDFKRRIANEHDNPNHNKRSLATWKASNPILAPPPSPLACQAIGGCKKLYLMCFGDARLSSTSDTLVNSSETASQSTRALPRPPNLSSPSLYDPAFVYEHRTATATIPPLPNTVYLAASLGLPHQHERELFEALLNYLIYAAYTPGLRERWERRYPGINKALGRSSITAGGDFSGGESFVHFFHDDLRLDQQVIKVVRQMWALKSSGESAPPGNSLAYLNHTFSRDDCVLGGQRSKLKVQNEALQGVIAGTKTFRLDAYSKGLKSVKIHIFGEFRFALRQISRFPPAASISKLERIGDQHGTLQLCLDESDPRLFTIRFTFFDKSIGTIVTGNSPTLSSDFTRDGFWRLRYLAIAVGYLGNHWATLPLGFQRDADGTPVFRIRSGKPSDITAGSGRSRSSGPLLYSWEDTQSASKATFDDLFSSWSLK